jgi:hypothetical protein
MPADPHDSDAKPDDGTVDQEDGVVDLTCVGSGEEGGGALAAVPQRDMPQALDGGPAGSPRCSDGR